MLLQVPLYEKLSLFKTERISESKNSKVQNMERKTPSNNKSISKSLIYHYLYIKRIANEKTLFLNTIKQKINDHRTENSMRRAKYNENEKEYTTKDETSKSKTTSSLTW